MRKIALSFLFISLFASVAMAGNVKTTVLKGQVLDKQGNPIVGAKVSLPNLNSEVYTDFDGEFVLANVPKSENTIQISMVSYEELKSNIDLSDFNQEFISIQLRSK